MVVAMSWDLGRHVIELGSKSESGKDAIFWAWYDKETFL